MTQTILVVDDSPTIQLLVKACLREENVSLVFASSGEQGLLKARELMPDLILLDVEMPPPDGFEICRRVKADPQLSGIPVVFLTSASSTAEKVVGLDLGAVDYITKPFDPAELCARVRASLRGKYMFDLLAQRAMIDGLTGLWNRTFLNQRLAAESAASLRHGRPLAAIVGDVDQFKRVNDAQGHPFGDMVLKHIAHAFASCCRAEDVVCRHGGEEFAVLTPGVGLEGAKMLAERIRVMIESSNFRHRSHEVRVTCSFGVAEASPTHCPEELIEEAEAALYQAKQSGRNCVAVHENSSPRPAPSAAVA